MKKIIGLIILSLFVLGCSNLKLDSLENNRSTFAVTKSFDYPKDQVFNVIPHAINNASQGKLSVRYQNFDQGRIYAQNSNMEAITTDLYSNTYANKIMFGVYLSGDNPTTVKIIQWETGYAATDYNYMVFEEIRKLLANQNN